jgi:oligoribonuclease NrnB/cAMP/cGMP phosphodiesterase (DHH superfamily)
LELTPQERAVLQDVYDEAKNYFRSIEDTIQRFSFQKYKIAFIECSEHKSFVANEMLKDNDYITLIDKNKNVVSLRGVYEGCDVLAKKFNGGGHPKAAGIDFIPSIEELKLKWKEVLIADEVKEVRASSN